MSLADQLRQPLARATERVPRRVCRVSVKSSVQGLKRHRSPFAVECAVPQSRGGERPRHGVKVPFLISTKEPN